MLKLLLLLALSISSKLESSPETLQFKNPATNIRSKIEFNEYNFHRYSPLIKELGIVHNIDHKLILAVVVVESKFYIKAGSHKGALGLMQLMPMTAMEVGVKDRLDPEQNLRGGVLYLRKMLNRFDNNTELAIAAYNAGPGKVLKYKGIPPYVETQQYVKRVMYAHSLL